MPYLNHEDLQHRLHHHDGQEVLIRKDAVEDVDLSMDLARIDLHSLAAVRKQLRHPLVVCTSAPDNGLFLSLVNRSCKQETRISVYQHTHVPTFALIPKTGRHT